MFKGSDGYEYTHESTELIYDWFIAEFKEFAVSRGKDNYCKSFSIQRDKLVDFLACSRGGVSLILYIRELEVSVWVVTPKARSKIKEVNLIDPASIESIQTIVRHLISVTLSPWYNISNIR